MDTLDGSQMYNYSRHLTSLLRQVLGLVPSHRGLGMHPAKMARLGHVCFCSSALGPPDHHPPRVSVWVSLSRGSIPLAEVCCESLGFRFISSITWILLDKLLMILLHFSSFFSFSLALFSTVLLWRWTLSSHISGIMTSQLTSLIQITPRCKDAMLPGIFPLASFAQWGRPLLFLCSWFSRDREEKNHAEAPGLPRLDCAALPQTPAKSPWNSGSFSRLTFQLSCGIYPLVCFVLFRYFLQDRDAPESFQKALHFF